MTLVMRGTGRRALGPKCRHPYGTSMTKSNGANPRKTDVKVSLIGGHRLEGATLHRLSHRRRGHRSDGHRPPGRRRAAHHQAEPDRRRQPQGPPRRQGGGARVAPGRSQGRRTERAGRPDRQDRRLGPGGRRHRPPCLARRHTARRTPAAGSVRRGAPRQPLCTGPARPPGPWPAPAPQRAAPRCRGAPVPAHAGSTTRRSHRFGRRSVRSRTRASRWRARRSRPCLL